MAATSRTAREVGKASDRGLEQWAIVALPSKLH
jgi:hypothetical protein